jgi:hypothetical protein
MTEGQLMSHFKFDKADLQANRSGRLTEAQNTRLMKADRSHKTYSLVMGIILFVVAVVGIGIAASNMMKFPDVFGFTSPFVLGFGVLWPLIWGGLGVVVIRRAFSTFKVDLVKVEGLVNIVKVQREESSTAADGSHETKYYYAYEMHVGPATFDVDGALAGIMMQGDNYAVYYTKGSESQILSAELISKAK